jgi:molybdate transport system substrate-binding protein
MQHRLPLVLIALAACKEAPAPAAVTEIKVGAASDLAFAFTEVGKLFEQQTGGKVTFSFGSTGQLAKQISEGAPFDVFAAANVSFVDEVVKSGACRADTKALYARGRVVAWTDGKVQAVESLAALADPRYVKIALANPEHAPYGKAAMQALTAAGVLDKVQSKLVYGENVKQAMQFAQSGNAEVALVALSLAIVSEGGQYLTIDDTLHAPLDQALVVCGAASPAARQFAELVSSPAGRTIMRRYGFLLPGEVTAQAQ